jgi:hypothetical protein
MSALAIHRPGLGNQSESADNHLVGIESTKKERERVNRKSKWIPIKLELDLPGMHAHPENEIIGAQIDKPRV